MLKSDKAKARLLFLILRLKSAKEEFVPLDTNFRIFNGGTMCDMYKGPCSCGSWHSPGDAEKYFGW